MKENDNFGIIIIDEEQNILFQNEKIKKDLFDQV
jgi:hypothetical protein